MTKTPKIGAAAIALARELQALTDLHEWRPVATRVEAVTTALRGGDGISEREVADLRAACARWPRLSSSLREFYAHHAPRDAIASIALWHLLFKPERDGISGPMRGHLRRLWSDHNGASPAADLYPWRQLTQGEA